MGNRIEEILTANNIITKSSIVKISDRVRDNAKISVMKCENSGVIFLSSDKHVNDDYYINKNKYEYWGVNDWNKSLLHTGTDDKRRKNQFIDLIRDKKILDYGCGNGGFLKLIKEVTDISDGVEIQSDILKILNDNNMNVRNSIDDFRDSSYDVITLFHVLEHLINPIEHLTKIKTKLNDGGKIIIEVPHANDFLIKRCDNDTFKNFTFWSEHLILHTKESLQRFLEVSGYKNIEIIPHQRYPLSNHLYWLSEGKPNGHNIWGDFNNKDLESHYSDQLKKLNLTDTLIAIAEK